MRVWKEEYSSLGGRTWFSVRETADEGLNSYLSVGLAMDSTSRASVIIAQILSGGKRYATGDAIGAITGGLNPTLTWVITAPKAFPPNALGNSYQASLPTPLRRPDPTAWLNSIAWHLYQW